MLYHYTSLNGLIGILASQNLWASHCDFLNDSQEYHEAIDFLAYQTSKIFMDDDYLSPIAWVIRDAIEKLYKKEIYITSFSEQADLLSQWRGYCDQGIGGCIGFNKDLINEFCAQQGYDFNKCIYDNGHQADLLHQLIKDCISTLPQPTISRLEFENAGSKTQVDHEIGHRIYLENNNQQTNNALSVFKSKTNVLAPMIKNSGFKEEAEWRIVIRNLSSSLKFRASKSHIVPYIELPLIKEKRNIIEEIIVGPNPKIDRCMASVEKLLLNYEMSHVKISQSKIPFNNW